MNIKMFYHSLLSDWNHGNAHFLRGIATELISRGNNVKIYESLNSWSFNNLLKDKGERTVEEFNVYYPVLKSIRYELNKLDLDEVLNDAHLVIVHEWNEPELINMIGAHREYRRTYKVLFHDTHHRAVTDKESMKKFKLKYYDGALVFGNVLKKIYLKNKWLENVWVFHEAADTKVFLPLNRNKIAGDVVWIGNWGDEERTSEIYDFLIDPIKKLKLKAAVYGVRYPEDAVKKLSDAGIKYGGYLPNYKVPEIFSQYKFTVHIPRRPYIETLPGIPTIRPFEALACGIPLISRYWNDSENLFTPGKDFLMVNDKTEMIKAMKLLMKDYDLAKNFSLHGLNTVLKKHTCVHRVDQLYKICKEIGLEISEKKVA